MGNSDVDVTGALAKGLLGAFVYGTQMEMLQGSTLLFFPKSNFDVLCGFSFTGSERACPRMLHGKQLAGFNP